MKKYKVEIYQDDQLIISKEVQKNEYSLQGIEVGRYRWRVASIDYWDQIGEFSNFSISLYLMPSLLSYKSSQKKDF